MTKFNPQGASRLRKPEETPKTFEPIKEEKEQTVKIYGEISSELYNRFLDYVAHVYYNQSEVMGQALEQFLSDKEFPQRPDFLKNRKRPGRPRKS